MKFDPQFKLKISEFKAFLAGNPELESGVIHCDLNSLNIIGQQVGESGSFQ